ncbi:testis-expressed protein 12-like [Cololabis saira]|uniref:testis-expressed protein 12-like n=1 Tax=Cololabis saira TaxID=129043 RepID=UPI002AD35A0F|nr:testis-expressed protein 12-like [Cololabis saira]
MAGKLTPPTFKKQTVNNLTGPKQAAPKEMECTLSNEGKSPPTKKKTPQTSTVDSAGAFAAAAAANADVVCPCALISGASRELNMLVANFAEVLSERAAGDNTQMKELEGLLVQARNLESHLKEKKQHLKQTLALISDKLQG